MSRCSKKKKNKTYRSVQRQWSGDQRVSVRQGIASAKGIQICEKACGGGWVRGDCRGKKEKKLVRMALFKKEMFKGAKDAASPYLYSLDP